MNTVLSDLTTALESLHPRLNAEFADPAEAVAIRNAERQLDATFNDDLRKFLLAANGQRIDGDWFAGDPVLPRLRFGPQPEHFSAHMHPSGEVGRFQIVGLSSPPDRSQFVSRETRVAEFRHTVQVATTT